MIASFVTLFFVFLVSIRLAISWKQGQRKKYKLPEGPRGIPLLGNVHQIVKNPHLKFSEWAKEYGSAYSIFLGTRPALVLSDVQSMKEMFSQQVATGKFKNDSMLLMSRGPYGILNTEGETWAEQRQFCLRNLVKFGFGKRSLEPLILSECQEMIQLIKDKSSDTDECAERGLELNQYLKCSGNNTLMTILTGERVRLEDRKVSQLVKEFMDCFQYSMKTGLGFFPLLKHIAPVMSGYVALDNATKNTHKFFENIFERHAHTSVRGSPRDMIDAYQDQLETSNKKSSFYGELGLKHCVSSVVELFEAGSETTAATITWLIYYMAQYPNIQRLVHEELDFVLGSRDPSLQDKSCLPYMEAVILETMRMVPVVPFGVIHELLEDMEFQEYRLPKGMLLIANIYHCHHDINVWKDPENFRPERFLQTTENNKIQLKELLVPFQIGKRSCLGEPLAKDIMFLFVAKLLQEFDVKCAPGISTEEYFDPDMGMGLLPKPRRVVMRSRSN